MGPGRANPSFKCRLLLMKLKSFPESWGLWEGKKLCGKGGIEHWHGQQLTFGLYQQSGSRQQRVQYCFLRVSLCCSSQAHSPHGQGSWGLSAFLLPQTLLCRNLSLFPAGAYVSFSSKDTGTCFCWVVFSRQHCCLLLFALYFRFPIVPDS